MNIIFFGAPGSGKGTQSAKLVEQYRLSHISSGDLFRGAIRSGSALGVQVKAYIERGDLVPDELTIKMVMEALHAVEAKNFVLDGFPRTVEQAKALDVKMSQSNIEIDAALFLNVDSKILLERLTGRRICGNCNSVFHVATKPPSTSGKCDKCGSTLIHRADDKADVIGKRLDKYFEYAVPLKSFYEEKGIAFDCDGIGSEEEVFARIKKVLEKLGVS